MKRLLLALVLAPQLAAAAPARPRKAYTIEQLMKNTLVAAPTFSGDGSSILYTSDETGIRNAYLVPAAGGPARALTRSKVDSVTALATFPKDDRILFSRDHGGDENSHIFVVGGDGKERDLTPGDKLKAQFFGWSHDLAGFYVLTNERDPKYFDLYRYSVASLERTLLYKDEVGYDLAGISDDEKWLAFHKLNTTVDTDVFLYDVAAKKLGKITQHEGVASYDAATFDPPSKALLLLTNDGSEFTRLRRYDLATGKSEDVEKASWDIDDAFFSWGGKYRAITTNEDGRSKVAIVEVATGAALALPGLPSGEITGLAFSRAEDKLVFVLKSDRAPANIYVYDIAKQALTRVTDTLNKAVDPEDLVDSEVVRFKSFDGLEIPNILYKPHQAADAHRAPALVWVHGGPGGQSRPGFNPLAQLLVNHGYVILEVNNRGSSGYGKTFFAADDRKHGHEPLQDCVEARRYLASLPYVDPARVGIIGGSYGGYMVLAALAFQPQVFSVGVDLFGVANWVRILKSIPPYWESRRLALYAELGDPEKDAAMLQEISPLFHAEKIVKPLMVLQGANDPRVLKVESDEMVAAVRKNRVPVEYVVFPDEGHGFAKRKNEIEGYGKILRFLDQHLRGR